MNFLSIKIYVFDLEISYVRCYCKSDCQLFSTRLVFLLKISHSYIWQWSFFFLSHYINIHLWGAKMTPHPRSSKGRNLGITRLHAFMQPPLRHRGAHHGHCHWELRLACAQFRHTSRHLDFQVSPYFSTNLPQWTSWLFSLTFCGAFRFSTSDRGKPGGIN